MAIDFTRIRRIQSKAIKLAIVLLFFTAICLLITSSTQRFPPLPPPVALLATDGRTNTLGSTTRTDMPELTTDLNTLRSTTSKYAYATLFTEGAEKEEDDKYLICTRMLTYQLLHDPAHVPRDRFRSSCSSLQASHIQNDIDSKAKAPQWSKCLPRISHG